MLKILRRKPKNGNGPGNNTPLYTYLRATKMRTPGAMEYGFATELLAWRPWIGAAIGFKQQMLNFGPQAYQSALANTRTGLGGVATGQLALQPLSDPYNNRQNGS